MAAGGYALAQGLNLVVYLVLARLLTPEEFGVYAAATILLGFMGLVSESGITSALIHRKDRIEEAMSTGAVWTLLAGARPQPRRAGALAGDRRLLRRLRRPARSRR